MHFALTGMTSQDSKAMEPVDDQEVTMMHWLQYALLQFWAQLALVTVVYPPPFFVLAPRHRDGVVRPYVRTYVRL